MACTGNANRAKGGLSLDTQEMVPYILGDAKKVVFDYPLVCSLGNGEKEVGVGRYKASVVKEELRQAAYVKCAKTGALVCYVYSDAGEASVRVGMLEIALSGDKGAMITLAPIKEELEKITHEQAKWINWQYRLICYGDNKSSNLLSSHFSHLLFHHQQIGDTIDPKIIMRLNMLMRLKKQAVSEGSLCHLLIPIN